MLFKNNKVWASVDANDNPIVENGRVLIKYRIDQDYEYKVLAKKTTGSTKNLKAKIRKILTQYLR